MFWPVKRQTTLRITDNLKLAQWHHRLHVMRQAKTLDALIACSGSPQYKIRKEGFEIWRYPLGVEDGMSYSIHVSVWPDKSPEVIMYFEPTEKQSARYRRRWWEFWKKKRPINTEER